MKNICVRVFILIFISISNIIHNQENPKFKIVQITSDKDHIISLMCDEYICVTRVHDERLLGINEKLILTPTKIERIKKAEQVPTSDRVSLCVNDEGMMYSLGYNNHLQSGNKTQIDKSVPITVLGETITRYTVGINFVSIDVNHSLCTEIREVYTGKTNVIDGQLENVTMSYRTSLNMMLC